MRARELHQVGGVALIHDGEVLRQTGRLSVAAEQSVRRGVERSPTYPLAVAAYEFLRAGQHLLRCSARERQQQYALGRHAPLNEVRHPIHERARLARARTGDDEKGAIAVGCSRGLLRIQL